MSVVSRPLLPVQVYPRWRERPDKAKNNSSICSTSSLYYSRLLNADAVVELRIMSFAALIGRGRLFWPTVLRPTEAVVFDFSPHVIGEVNPPKIRS